MGRLGTREPGGPTYDIHQGNLRVDERATAIGAKVLATVAVGALLSLVAERSGSPIGNTSGDSPSGGDAGAAVH